MAKPPPVPSKDLEFLRKPHLWPHFPVMPLIRKRGEEKDYGVIVATVSHTIVFSCLMFFVPDDVAELMKLPQYRYTTIEELLADGWRVD